MRLTNHKPASLVSALALTAFSLLLSAPSWAGGPAESKKTQRTTEGSLQAPPLSKRQTGIIIKYKSASAVSKTITAQYAGQNAAGLGFANASAAASRYGITLLFDKPLATGAYVLRQSGPLSPEQQQALISEIAKDPAVEYVEVDALMRPQLVPNDGYYSSQWHLKNVTGGINMPAAWDLASGSGIKVAVLDTGITSHPDLTPNIVGGYDFVSDAWMANDGGGRDPDPSDPGDWITWSEYFDTGYQCDETDSSWHGTHVAGTIAAITNNGTGVAGIAHSAKVVPVRVLGKCGGTISDIADGIIWAAGGNVPGVPANPNPARIINMSLGGDGVCGPTFQAAIDIARNRNVLVVVAAGNSNRDTTNFTPANCQGVLTVAATDEYGGKAYFSNYGRHVGLAAPGTDVWSTLNSGTQGPVSPNYVSYQGTSMATPHVAGVAALLMQKEPSLTAKQVAGRMKLGSSIFSSTCSLCGVGILNAYQSLVPPTFPAGTVFRFYNLTSGIHLFSANSTERDLVLAEIPDFLYERTAFKVKTTAESGTSPVWRYRNKNTGAYFFTINPSEKAIVDTLPYFALEGVAWYARTPQSPGTGTLPLYRFLHKPSGSHFYSYSSSEANNLRNNLSHIYQYEGIGFYVWP